MQFVFTKALNSVQIKDADELYRSISVVSIEQYPGWAEINNPGKKITSFLCYDSGRLISFAVIIEKYRIARINHGPLNIDPEYYNEILAEIFKYYKARKFAKIIVKPPLNWENNIQFDITDPAGKLNISQKNDDPENWSTLVVNLSEHLPDIRKKYSENHKRAIKKACKLDLKIRIIDDPSEVTEFSNIYDKLYKNRKLIKSFKDTNKVFSEILLFFKTYNLGQIWGVFFNNKLIGGVILIIQNKSVFYQYGASDVNFKNIPVMHLVFDHAIEYYKNNGFLFFDFGGYPKDVEITDQIYQINRFKKGFGGSILIYPPCFSIIINKNLDKMLEVMKNSRNRIFR